MAVPGLGLSIPGRCLSCSPSLCPGGAVHVLVFALAEAANNFDRLIFGTYFLVPFGFSLAVLLLEMGLVMTRSAMIKTALAVPPLLLLFLASIGHNPGDPVYQMLTA